MAEELIKLEGSKEAIYQGLLPQIKGLISGETDQIANLANVCAALNETFDFLWVGFCSEREGIILKRLKYPKAIKTP